MADTTRPDLKQMSYAQLLQLFVNAVSLIVKGNIRRRTRMPKGGHFAALEQPDALAHEVIAFFDDLSKA